jgi:hypothetical protein
MVIKMAGWEQALTEAMTRVAGGENSRLGLLVEKILFKTSIMRQK